MSFEWSIYRNIAQELFDSALTVTDATQTGLREGRFRLCISAAYYAAFQTAKEYLIERNFYYPSDDASRSGHIYVIRTFDMVRDVKAKTIKTDLDIIRRYRVVADYEKVFQTKDSNDPEDIATRTLAKSQLVIELVKKLQRQK
jgi:uncharacterized protein (UPF0332 family)